MSFRSVPLRGADGDLNAGAGADRQAGAEGGARVGVNLPRTFGG